MKINLRKFSIVLAFLLVISIGINIASALTANDAEPGTDQDPLITKSYVDEATEKYMAEIAKLKEELNTLKTQQQSGGSQGFVVLTVEAGQTLLPGAGTEMILRSGKATAVAGKDGNLADVTSAKDLAKGVAAVVNHLLISSRDDGRGLKASVKCYFLIRGAYKTSGTQQVESSISEDSGSIQTDNNTGTTENKPLKYKVNASPTLNLRSSPDKSASILAKIPNGQEVTILASGGEWLNIKTSSGISGWVLAEYITME